MLIKSASYIRGNTSVDGTLSRSRDTFKKINKIHTNYGEMCILYPMLPQPSQNDDSYPMRINRYLAKQGIATRREADTLIEKGWVFINDRRAILGDKIAQDDTVKVKTAGKPKIYHYAAYYKPKGVVTSAPQKGEVDIRTATKEQSELKDLFPVGRLDKDSHGLIVLTNDGRITDRLLNPKHAHDKEYLVKVREHLRPSFKTHMEKSVDIGDCVTKPAKVEVMNDHTFSITLTEGKKHQVKRMAEAMHLTVTDLKRVRILNLSIGDLKPGDFRIINGRNREDFLKTLGL